MGYDNIHRITSKSQHLTQNNVQFNGTLNVGYDLTYTYGTEAGKKFQLTNVKDVNYRTEQTPGDNKIENNHVYLYDLKSATKLFSVLLASKRPLITELADKLRLKYPLLPTISPCPTMRLEAIRSIIPISCRRYPKSV